MEHVAGRSRYQSELMSPSLDELVDCDSAVRVIDAFVDGLDLRRLGFARVETAATGRPPYAPGDLLKLYIYGYMNQMRSSRRLEREAQRNLEAHWLIDRLRPSDSFPSQRDDRLCGGVRVSPCSRHVRGHPDWPDVAGVGDRGEYA